MENTNQTQIRDLCEQLNNNLTKSGMIEAVATIGKVYVGFTHASFDVAYHPGFEWIKVYAHYSSGKCFMGSEETKNGVELIETIYSALLKLNDKIMRGFNIPVPDLSTHTMTALESTEPFLSENESSDLKTENAA